MNEREISQPYRRTRARRKLLLFKVHWTSEMNPPPDGETWVTFVRAPRLQAARDGWWGSPDARRFKDARIVRLEKVVEADPYEGIV